jgi:hypothetical protein
MRLGQRKCRWAWREEGGGMKLETGNLSQIREDTIWEAERLLD